MQVGSLIGRAAEHFKDAPCLVEGERVVSFREFDDLTDRLGNGLLRSGLVPGDRVGVLMPNGIDCLIAYYALAKSGLVRVSLNVREKPMDHAYKLEDSGSRAIFCSEHEIVPEGIELCFRPADLTRLIEQTASAPCAVDRDLETPYRLGYTGGTTGQPKGVTLTMRGETAELSAFLCDLVPDMRLGDTFLHAAPIAHASGAFFLPALVRGVRSLVMKKFDPAAFLDLAESEQASMTFLVPTMIAMVMEEPRCAVARLNLRRIVYGASPIADGLLRRAEARFGKLFAQTYGQAEGPRTMTGSAPVAAPSRQSRPAWSTRTTISLAPARWARSYAAAPNSWRATGTGRRPRNGPSAMAGSTPAISAAWTRTATSTFSTGRTTC